MLIQKRAFHLGIKALVIRDNKILYLVLSKIFITISATMYAANIRIYDKSPSGKPDLTIIDLTKNK
jgi:hypothetical protein